LLIETPPAQKTNPVANRMLNQVIGEVGVTQLAQELLDLSTIEGPDADAGARGRRAR
jgi:hypothetical protein